MFCIQKWKCSYTLAATIALIFASLSVVHFFLYPVVPSPDYFSLSQGHTSCVPVDGSTEKIKKSTPINGPIRCGKLTFPVNGSIEGSNEDTGQNLQPMVDLNVQFPADLHNAVSHRGAPWKAEIGRWLSGCNSNTKVVKIVEKIGGNSCKNECSGQGVCNYELSQCNCFHGFSGEGCLERLNLSCNYPG
ncbi:Phosphate transporter PHO1 homolog 9 [Olea europaea subsp. europaea]|uniref:Phosphate transporter PHO1 homolog 9 n=2 Tax=Olea europaea subsp. europaea TaxID=158383 RepID=A0A8S0RTD9_OLEEU|nr:Phosphate transporter PHO1 homolog 9 [Olea europaea subsp. europaea]